MPRKCLADIRKAAKEFLSDADTEELIKQVERERKVRLAEGTIDSIDDALSKRVDEIADEIKRAAQIEKRNHAINLLKRKQILDLIDERFADKPHIGLEGYMVGNSQYRSSIDARANAIEMQLLGGMFSEVRKADLIPHLNSRELDLEIAKEMWEIGKADGKPGISGSKEAKQLAEIFNKYQKIAVRIQNDLGADIRVLPGYIVRQSHDVIKLRRSGFDKWRENVLEHLDHEKTFKGADPEKFLQEAYDGLVSGIHMKHNGSRLDEVGRLSRSEELGLEFKGPSNLAKKISQERVLHFKDAEGWHLYNEEFGHGNLTESVVGGLTRAGRNAALMEGFGTNPRAMFQSILEHLESKHKNTAAGKQLGKNKFKWYMDELDGSVNIPGSTTGAIISSSIRAVQSMSKLGMATISSFNDMVTKASQLKFNGVNYLEGYKNSFEAVFGGFNSKEQRIAADLLGVGLDGMLGKVFSRFNGHDTLGRNFARANQVFFKFSLLTPWTDAHKTGFTLMLSRNLAMNSKKKWGDLPKELQHALGLYFDSKQWDLIRKGVRDIEGKSYVMTDSIRDLSDADIKSVLGDVSQGTIRKFKQRLETDLRAYYVDQADSAIPTPGAREQAFMRMGTQPGTIKGELFRFFMQFKAFPITFLTKGLGKFFPGDDVWYKQLVNGQADKRGIAHMMLATTAMGYLSMTTKDLLKGKKPRDVSSPEGAGKVLLASFIQGGGAGIYGDFLFGQKSRFGRSSLGTLLGPTFGSASDALDLIKTVPTDPAKVPTKGLNFLKSHTPFANLFYTKYAMDYMFIWEMQEAMNPGYMKRMEKRVKKDNDQEFFISPSESVRGGLVN